MANFSLLALIGVDTKAFQKGLKEANGSTKKFGKSVTATLAKAAAAFGGIALGKNMIRLGMDAEEVADKFNTVLGPAAESLNNRISKLMKTVPATRAELQNTIATVSQMGMAFGMNEEAAGKFALGITKISADLASFHNMKPEEVFNKMQAAITGEFEGLKRLGIVINETRLKEEALALGLGDGKAALDAQAKAITVQSIVLKDMGSALGNAAQTQDSSANRTKFFTRELEELQTEIGTRLIPIFAQLLKILLPFVRIVSNNVESTIAWTKRLLIFISALKIFSTIMPVVSKGILAYSVAAKAGASATNILSVSIRRLGLSIKSLLASTGIGLLVVALSELGFMAINAATSTDKATDDMTDDMAKLNAEIEETIALVEESTSSVASSAKGQGEYAEELENTAAAVEKAAEAQKTLEDKISSYFDKVKQATAAEHDRFIGLKELEALRMRAKGDNAGADALDEQIRKMKEAMDVAKKYGITLLEASKIQLAIEANKVNKDEDKKKSKMESLEAKITEMKLKALNAQANGDKLAEEAMLKRIKYAEKIVSLMNDFNMSQEQARNLAVSLLEKEEEGSGASSGLTGEDLRKGANIAGEADGIRFERLGGGGYQQFIKGKKGEKFTEEQMQAGLQKQIDKDPSEALLEKINATLEGKFVSQ